MALNDGLLTRSAIDLALSADGSVLYLATEGGGVFRLGTPPQTLQEEETMVPSILDESTQSPAPAASEAEPSGGGGFCGGVALLPLALVGLAWIQRRRR
jgi:uncharacterized protein (TIGR03382 family)